MLNRTWRIVLLVIVLIGMIWPSLIGSATWWVSLAAAVILLIGEVSYDNSHCEMPMERKSSRASKRRRRR